MMPYYDIEEFKSICYEVETLTNRSWLIEKYNGHIYPNSYYSCIFKSISGNLTLLVCNAYLPVFALANTDSIEDFNDPKFTWEESIFKSVEKSFQIRQRVFEFLTPEFLNLKFHSKTDFEVKTSTLDIDPEKYPFTMKLLKLEQYDYVLFHGGYVGCNLFNSMDDSLTSQLNRTFGYSLAVPLLWS